MNFNKLKPLTGLILLPVVIWAGGPQPIHTNLQPRALQKSVSGLGVDANNHDLRKIARHNGNKILTRFYNYGAIANWRVPGRYDCGIYPIGSGHSYLAEFTPLVASSVQDTRGLNTSIISDGIVASTKDAAPNYLYQFEPVLGYANPNDSLVAMSDDSISWPDTWADRSQQWDNKWDGQYGQYARADQESYFHIDDYNNDEFKFYPFKRAGFVDLTGDITAFTSTDSNKYAYLVDTDVDFTTGVVDSLIAKTIDTRAGERPDVVQINGNRFYEVNKILGPHKIRLFSVRTTAAETVTGASYTIFNGIKRGLGMEISVRGYQWAHPAAEDILIWTYWIKNQSDWDFSKFVFGMYGDADVGDDGDQGDDDSFFDTYNDIVYQWDHDMWSTAKGGFVPAYFGWKYLESPGDPLDGVDNDEDGMIDESQYDGIDNDGDWDPRVDDVGSDGLGPQHQEYTGPDADGTEGNGVPDLGEPNFEYTDNDESDQLGLTSFTAAAWPTINPSNDALTYNQLIPGSFTDIVQTVDITFMYGSAYFKLPIGESRKFAVAMVFGEDYPDILRNSQTMQQIYNSDYNFAKPPIKPTVTAVPGDQRVTLYWDDKAQFSLDPIYGHDFEGYRIYRATDPNFTESWVITDAYGNRTFNKPVAQFDLADGLTGPHPIGLNGLQMDMGTDTGISNFWVDTNVENGQQYYYAVVAYDRGYDLDFYERGLAEKPNLQAISPSETNKRIEVDPAGRVLGYDSNTVGVMPNAPAVDYVAPEIVADTTRTLATGSYEIVPVDPRAIQNGDQYTVTFKDWSNDGIDNDGDWRTFSDDSTFITMSATLILIIPPNSDTLHVHFQSASATVSGPNIHRFNYLNYVFETTVVEQDSSNGQIRYYVSIPDTDFVQLPTLGIWNGTEKLHDDLGADGCNDEYEDGSGGCLEAPNPAYVAGTDPNGDNWNPVTNRFGTQANGKPESGELHLDARDIDEIVRKTSWYDVKNVSSNTLLLTNQTDLAGDAKTSVAEGFQVNITNDVTGLDAAGSGWTTTGINLDTRIGLINYGNFKVLSVPFDYVVTITDAIADTSKNFKLAAFTLYDQTNSQRADFIYLPSENDSILKDGARIYPFIDVAGEKKVGYQMEFVAKAANISRIIEWDGAIVMATADRGLVMFDGEHFQLTNQSDGLAANAINDLMIDPSNRLWVASTGGLNIQTAYGWQTYSIPIGNKGTQVEFTGITLDTRGYFWASTPNGVYKAPISSFNGGSTPVSWRIYNDTNDGLAQLSNVGVLALDSGAVLVASKGRGLSFYHPAADSFTVLDRNNSDLPDNNITVIRRRGDLVFIGTKTKGFAVYNLASGFIEYSNKDSLLNRAVNDLEFGPGNSVYVATKKGVNILDYTDPAQVSFDSTITRATAPDILSNVVQALEVGSDELWLGTKYNVARYDGSHWDNFNPKAGSEYILRTTKPYSALDTLRFTAYGSQLETGLTESVLADVAVVPNPYVVTASWEPQNLYASGRGIRKLDFIHLPSVCTIKIFTLSGKLVRTIEHAAPGENGSQSWDLLSRDGLEIAYGIYIYHIEAPGIGSKVGKFAVIK